MLLFTLLFLDAVTAVQYEGDADGRARVEKLIYQITSLGRQVAPSPGSGTQHRMEGENLSASALEVADHIYHLSAIV